MLIKEVNVNARNFEQKTALDLFEMQPHKNEEVRKILSGARVKNASRLPKPITLADYLIRNLTFIEGRDRVLGISNPISREKSNTDIRNIILVIAILIATATYQAVLSPPGGFWQEDSSVPDFSSTSNETEILIVPPHRAGQMVMGGVTLICFFTANTLAFLTSVTTILTMITGLFYTQMLSLSVGFLLINYSVSISYNFRSGYGSWAAIFAGLVLYLLVVLVYGTPLLSLKANKLKGRIDTPKRRVGDFLNSI